MNFLNVYPKRLWATLNPEGVFEGQFIFDLEQYGLITSNVMCDVTVAEDRIMVGQWKIRMKPLFDIDMPHFDKFVDTLNHYVFEVLQFMPNRSASGNDAPMLKLFFTDMYFDMSGSEPVVKKIEQKPPSK